MGQIGFVFNFLKIDKKKVVFVDSSKIKQNSILGFSSSFDSSKIDEFCFLRKDLIFESMIPGEHSRVCYAKICVNDKNKTYFDDMTIWVDANLYKELWSCLHLESENKDVILTSVNKIIELLKL